MRAGGRGFPSLCGAQSSHAGGSFCDVRCAISGMVGICPTGGLTAAGSWSPRGRAGVSPGRKRTACPPGAVPGPLSRRR
ncbi:hypothetical protein KPATCC21470_1764 [Kitasatospora purpeofusca]